MRVEISWEWLETKTELFCSDRILGHCENGFDNLRVLSEVFLASDEDSGYTRTEIRQFYSPLRDKVICQESHPLINRALRSTFFGTSSNDA